MRRLVYFIPKKTPYSQIVHVESHILSAIKWPTFIWLQVAKVPEQLSAINCDKNFYYSTTAKTVEKSTNIPKYLYGRKPVYSTGWHAHAKLSHTPSFIDKFIDYSSWIINLLLDVLVCSITVHIYSSFTF